MSSTDRFGYEWSTYQQILPEYEDQFKKWVYPLKSGDFKNKTILDAGCGIGRNSYWPLTYHAKKVVAFDFDRRTVEVAKKNLIPFSNAKVEYASIYDIRYRLKFDLTLCIGVLHHLIDPVRAIRNLVRATKKRGQLLFWVYGYEGNEWIVTFINPLRKLTSKMPIILTHKLAFFFSVPLYLMLKTIPQRQPYFIQLSHFSFPHVHSIIFDQLLPNIANYWKKEEIVALMRKSGIRKFSLYRVNDNSWTLLISNV